MKKMIQIILAVLLAMPIASKADNLVKESSLATSSVSDVGVKMWANNNDGIYYAGENITIYFQADRDCYVTVYSVDTRGEVSILYPVERWDDGYIRGGATYAIPDDHADYDLTVTGPEGIEHIVAVASAERPDIVGWYDKAPVECGTQDDRDEFINYVNQQYFGSGSDDFQGQDRVLVYIKENHYYYKPVYVPQTWYDYPDYSVVYIDYPFGGEVYIDGIYFGIAPLWIPRVIIGYHWITVYDRYGYCWEDHIDIHHNNTLHLDRSRVRTSQTVVSRFKDVRSQAKQYTPTSYIKSEQRVRGSVVASDQSAKQKYYRNSLGSPSNTGGAGSVKSSTAGQSKQSSDRGKYTPSSDVKSRQPSPSVQDNQTKQSKGSQVDRGSSKASPAERDKGSSNSQPSGQKEQKVDSPKKSWGNGRVASIGSSVSKGQIPVASPSVRDKGSSNSQPSGQKEQKVNAPERNQGNGSVAATGSPTPKGQSPAAPKAASRGDRAGASGNGGKK